jgi:hypothetical protein
MGWEHVQRIERHRREDMPPGIIVEVELDDFQDLISDDGTKPLFGSTKTRWLMLLSDPHTSWLPNRRLPFPLLLKV